MGLELVLAIENADHGEVQHAAGLARQSLPPPHGAPAIFGHEVLQRPVEVVGALERGVDIGVAENGAADFETLVVGGFVHILNPLLNPWLHDFQNSGRQA